MPVEPSQGPRRSRGLEDIAPQYVAKSGLCASTEMESPRGSLRIRHLIGSPSSNQDEDQARFPRLDQCAHFHYDQVDLPPLQVSLYNEELKSLSCDTTSKCHAVQVRSHGVSWLLRRSYENFKLLDQQLHRCIYDRKFSMLPCLPDGEDQDQASSLDLLERYLARFSQIAGNLINCGPVLNWLELDNRGRRLLVPDNDNCPINTPAVAAAYSVRQYSAQAGDEISFEVGDMISVIDMPPPEESVWWRGKRGFQVGFFPGSCVAVIGDKLPRSLLLPASVASLALGCEPSKPVLRKHGKLIAFFRSFILARPSRRRLKQSGILKERVFGCDLGEHLLNSGHQVPMVLKCCAEFIESHGIVDGIYRLSGVTSNIQKLRNAFDEDRVPALYEDEAILQDIHSVASLLKMYFRELPNPLCTYQLYHAFVGAVGAAPELRLVRMREAVAKLPPPHYRTLEYLMRHLARVAERGHMTGMTPRNVAIVWAPNLLRCKELEVGGVAALQGVGIQAVVTEFLVCYADLIFCDNLPAVSAPPPMHASPKRCRPKSLAISTPTKLLSLEEARTRALNSHTKSDTDYIEVGGGPSKLPAKYHTVIELPRKRSSSSKRSPLGWKSLFGKSGRKNSMRKSSTPTELGLHQESAVTESDLAAGRRRLRPVKSAESLDSSRNSAALEADKSSEDSPPSVHQSQASLTRGGHNRSASHDSYFDGLDTPVHARLSTRPSRLQEMDNEDVSSSLDLSEIQLNFDLEDSEMRIFSEDETLVSTSVGSTSLASHSSPHVAKCARVSAKRLPSCQAPPRARAEESACPSLDPSPKKQKTCEATSPTDSTRSKRSRLEERLASSTGELRFIDSQSPDNTVVVRAEVHPPRSYDPESPPYVCLADRDSTCSTSPSPLTTPYLAMTPSPSSASVTLPCRMSQSSSLDIPYNRLSAGANMTPNSSLSGNVTPSNALDDGDNVFRYEPPPPEPTRRPDYENVSPGVGAYQNLPAVLRSPPGSPLKESLITIRYENVKSPARHHAEEPGAYQNLRCDQDEHVYEDVQSPPEIVYQQVRHLRRSVHEINQLLEGDAATSPGEDSYRRVVFVSGDEGRSCDWVGEGSPAHSSEGSSTNSAEGSLERSADGDVVNDSVKESHSSEGSSTNSSEGSPVDSVEASPAHSTEAKPTDLTEGSLVTSVKESHSSEGNSTSSSEGSRIDSTEGSPVDSTEGSPTRSNRMHVTEESPINSVVGNRKTVDSVEVSLVDSVECSLVLSADRDRTSSVRATHSLEENATNSSEGKPVDSSEGSLMDSVEGSPAHSMEGNDVDSVEGTHSSEANRLISTEVSLAHSTEGKPKKSVEVSPMDSIEGSPAHSTEGKPRSSLKGSPISSMEGSPAHSMELKRNSMEGKARNSMEGSPMDSMEGSPAHSMEGTPRNSMEGKARNSMEGSPAHSMEGKLINSVKGSPINSMEGSPAHSMECKPRNSMEGSPMNSTEEKARNSVEGSPLNSVEGSPAHSMEGKPRNSVEESPLNSAEGSPAHSSEEPRHSRRRLESEIGRDILHERRMCQELEEVRYSSLGGRGSIRDLLSRFEAGPAEEPRLHRRYGDAGSLPPCVRARAAKTARRLASTQALSVSLDGGQFAAANDENHIVRVLTSPDIAKENETRQESSVLKPLNAIDDDPQRRERIERYKEERRLFLREKYRSESFKGDRDEILQRLKQKAGKTLSTPEERARCDVSKEEEAKRGMEVEGKRIERVRCDEDSEGKGTKKGVKGEADRVKRNERTRCDGSKVGVEVGGRRMERARCEEEASKRLDRVRGDGPRGEEGTKGGRAARTKEDAPITCVLVKERLSSDRMTVTMGLKGRDRLASNPEPAATRTTFAARPTSIDTTPGDRSWRCRPDGDKTSPSRTHPWGKPPGRRLDASSPPKTSWRTEPKRPTSTETTPEVEPARRRSSGSGSPSYCIRDMAALFENRGDPSRPPPPGKQFLSSM